jgi:hypothetical protein
MSYIYNVTTSNGDSYEVSVTKHHSDHEDSAFKKYLGEIIKSSISGAMSTLVVSYVLSKRAAR